MVTLAPSPPRIRPAIKASLTVLLCLGVATMFGRQDLGLLSVTGTFAVLYAPMAPIRRRLVTVGGIGLALIVSTTLGALTAVSTLLFAVTAILLAMVTAGLCLALRVGPPGSYFLVLCAGIAHFLAGAHGTPPVQIAGMTAVGTAVALTVTIAELLADPRRPERLAVSAAARAARAYADSEPGPDSRPLHRGASQALAAAEEAMAEGYWHRDATSTEQLSQARREYDTRARRATEYFLPSEDLSWDPNNPDAGRWVEEQDEPTDVDMPSASAAERAGHARAADEQQDIGSLRRRLTDGLRYPGEPWTVALSVGIATTASIVFLVGVLGGEQTHLYWVIAFSALILHQGGPRSARTYRAIHRMLGTIAGLGLFVAVSLLQPTGWWLVALIVTLQFSIELIVTRNYGLAVTLITPLALTVATGGRYSDEPWTLAGERLLDTTIGIVVALIVVWTVGRRAHHRAVRGDTRRVLRELAQFARGEAQDPAGPTLPSVLRDLHTSNSLLAADGHGSDPEARTAEELIHAGYLVLGASDRRAVTASAPRWTELAARDLPSGRRRVENDHPVDVEIRQEAERMGATPH